VPGAARGAGASTDVQVTQTDSPDPVKSGGLVTYTISILNSGSDPALNVSLDDMVPAGTTFSSLSSNFTVDCTKPAIGQGGAVNCKLGFPLGSGQTWQLLLGVTVNKTAPPAMVANTANISSGTSDPVAANNSDIETTTVDRPTAVTVHSLKAVRTARGVVVTWRTGSELGVIGFDVYRLVNGRLARAHLGLIKATARWAARRIASSTALLREPGAWSIASA
jgi:uncharacterized repeat protein (TIGR01451 family)